MLPSSRNLRSSRGGPRPQSGKLSKRPATAQRSFLGSSRSGKPTVSSATESSLDPVSAAQVFRVEWYVSHRDWVGLLTLLDWRDSHGSHLSLAVSSALNNEDSKSNEDEYLAELAQLNGRQTREWRAFAHFHLAEYELALGIYEKLLEDCTAVLSAHKRESEESQGSSLMTQGFSETLRLQYQLHCALCLFELSLFEQCSEIIDEISPKMQINEHMSSSSLPLPSNDDPFSSFAESRADMASMRALSSRLALHCAQELDRREQVEREVASLSKGADISEFDILESRKNRLSVAAWQYGRKQFAKAYDILKKEWTAFNADSYRRNDYSNSEEDEMDSSIGSQSSRRDHDCSALQIWLALCLYKLSQYSHCVPLIDGYVRNQAALEGPSGLSGSSISKSPMISLIAENLRLCSVFAQNGHNSCFDSEEMKHALDSLSEVIETIEGDSDEQSVRNFVFDWWLHNLSVFRGGMNAVQAWTTASMMSAGISDNNGTNNNNNNNDHSSSLQSGTQAEIARTARSNLIIYFLRKRQWLKAYELSQSSILSSATDFVLRAIVAFQIGRNRSDDDEIREGGKRKGRLKKKVSSEQSRIMHGSQQSSAAFAGSHKEYDSDDYEDDEDEEHPDTDDEDDDSEESEKTPLEGRAKDWSYARQLFEAVGQSSAEKDTVFGRKSMSSALILSEKFDVALKFLDSLKHKILDMNKENRESWYLNCALCAFKLRDYSKCEEMLDSVDLKKHLLSSQPTAMGSSHRSTSNGLSSAPASSSRARLQQSGDYRTSVKQQRTMMDDGDGPAAMDDRVLFDVLCLKTRCLIENGRPWEAWQVYLEWSDSLTAIMCRHLLSNIADICYDCEHFYYALKAFDALESASGEAQWSAKRGAACGVLRNVIKGEEMDAHLVDVVALMSTESNPQASYLLRVMREVCRDRCIDQY